MARLRLQYTDRHKHRFKARFSLILLAGIAHAAAAQASPAIPHNLSPLSMFQQADWVVKGVMLGLLFASVLTWTVWLVKSVELGRAYRSNRLPIQSLSSAHSLENALQADYQYECAATAFLAAAHEELNQSQALSASGIKERLEARFASIHAVFTRRAKTGTGVLATIGSVGPFVGLFGTVWGIMNAFIGISHAQTTNLAVVAPGIAEALLATALGLVAAIPAVVMYNIFARKIADYRAQLTDLASAVTRLVSMHLDRQASDQQFRRDLT